MSNTAEQIAQMVDILPDSEQLFALEFIKRLVLAWDPDYTKVTPTESAAIERGLEELSLGEFVRHEDIDWS
jgi:hypothetical protein